MKTRAELEKDIAEITSKIHNDYPELSKYMGEMPQNLTANDDNNPDLKKLQDYYNSLKNIVQNYAKTHDSE